MGIIVPVVEGGKRNMFEAAKKQNHDNKRHNASQHFPILSHIMPFSPFLVCLISPYVPLFASQMYQ